MAMYECTTCGSPVGFGCVCVGKAADTQLWALLIEGPDDLYAMPSRKNAEVHASILRPHFERMAAGKGITLIPKVIPWPHSAEAHAANMKEHLKDFS